MKLKCGLSTESRDAETGEYVVARCINANPRKVIHNARTWLGKEIRLHRSDAFDWHLLTRVPAEECKEASRQFIDLNDPLCKNNRPVVTKPTSLEVRRKFGDRVSGCAKEPRAYRQHAVCPAGTQSPAMGKG